MDVVDGKVFGSWMLRGPDLSLANIFLPLSRDEWREKLPDGVTSLYEYVDKKLPGTFPRGHPELPVFLSMKYLVRGETEQLAGFIAGYREYRKVFTEEYDGDQGQVGRPDEEAGAEV